MTAHLKFHSAALYWKYCKKEIKKNVKSKLVSVELHLVTWADPLFLSSSRSTIVRVFGQLEEVSHVFDASALGADICVFLLLSAFDTVATFLR